ncbi:hypothetical protein [Streptomyces parvulus]|uniref:hypothetical protein n=1 Tax=Streptomyces parvulus TaxID=146923 RepID=UPI00380E61F7
MTANATPEQIATTAIAHPLAEHPELTSVLSTVVLVLAVLCFLALPAAIVARAIVEDRARKAAVQASNERLHKVGEVA